MTRRYSTLRRTGFKRKTFEEARDERQGPRRFGLKRGKGLKPRVHKKARTADGARARDVKDECDQLVRDVIRLRDWKCATCPLTQNLHVGHLFRRGLEPVRWDLLNCAAQCDLCNGEHETEPEYYVRAFILRYREDAYNDLKTRSQSKHKFTYIELAEIRDGLRRELASLEAAQKQRRAA